MNLELEGRTALVLGASRGLGAAVAAALAREGATVIAAARTPRRIEEWRARLASKTGSKVQAQFVDLSDRASVDALADNLLPTGVDILVNNTGGPPPGTAASTGIDNWLAQFSAMAAHLFHLTGRLLPPMTARNWGRVITIASSGIEQPIPNLALSNSIRAAILGWSKTLANEVAAKGVTVNMVLPGRIQTERVTELDKASAARLGKSVDEVEEASRAAIPIGRYGAPEEFADVVTFVASTRASYMTGAKIRVDGGLIRSV